MGDMVDITKLSNPVREWVGNALQKANSKEKDLIRSQAKSLARNLRTKKEVQNAAYKEMPLLQFAAREGIELLFKLLLEEFHSDANLIDPVKETTALHWLAATGQREMIIYLLRKQVVDIDAVDQGMSTPLCCSISFSHLPVTRLLLNRNASIEIESFLGLPIHVATFKNNILAVKKLRKKKPEVVNAESWKFCTPLVVAALTGSTECLTYLASKVANINAKPLCYKLICNSDSEEWSLECINALLTFGMEASLYDEDILREELPILTAAKKGWTLVVERLLAHTDQIPGVDAWNVEGVVHYVNSDVFIEADHLYRQERVEELKELMMSELNRACFLTADLICKALRPDMPAEEWDRFQSLCSLLIQYGSYGTFLDLTVNCMTVTSYGLAMDDDIDGSLLAAKAAMALDPGNELSQNALIEAQGAIDRRAAAAAAAVAAADDI